MHHSVPLLYVRIDTGRQLALGLVLSCVATIYRQLISVYMPVNLTARIIGAWAILWPCICHALQVLWGGKLGTTAASDVKLPSSSLQAQASDCISVTVCSAKPMPACLLQPVMKCHNDIMLTSSILTSSIRMSTQQLLPVKQFALVYTLLHISPNNFVGLPVTSAASLCCMLTLLHPISTCALQGSRTRHWSHLQQLQPALPLAACLSRHMVKPICSSTASGLCCMLASLLLLVHMQLHLARCAHTTSAHDGRSAVHACCTVVHAAYMSVYCPSHRCITSTGVMGHLFSTFAAEEARLPIIGLASQVSGKAPSFTTTYYMPACLLLVLTRHTLTD